MSFPVASQRSYPWIEILVSAVDDERSTAAESLPRAASGLANMKSTPSPLRVAVLSSGNLGRVVANRLVELPEVDSVTLLVAPFVQEERHLIATIRRSIRYDGLVSTAADALRRLTPSLRSNADEPPQESRLHPKVILRRCQAFESRDALGFLRSFKPDLGVVAGTYILPPEVFDMPVLGSINLHSGKVPEYRGSAPGFWELYNGEDEVGITIHTVTAKLDAGEVLLQRTAPLDRAPTVDPLAYLEEYRREVLMPRGVQLLTVAVKKTAHDELSPTPQDEEAARTFPKPTIQRKRKLRGKVRARRQGEIE